MENLPLVVLGRRGEHALDPLEDLVVLGLALGAVFGGQLPRRVEEEDPEDEEQPVEVRQQNRADGNEDSAQDQCADDAQLQHLQLLLLGNGERRHDDDEDEQVVHRQAELGDVAGEELETELRPGREPDAETEDHRQRHVHQHRYAGLPHGDHVRPAAHDDEVDKEHERDARECDRPDQR